MRTYSQASGSQFGQKPGGGAADPWGYQRSYGYDENTRTYKAGQGFGGERRSNAYQRQQQYERDFDKQQKTQGQYTYYKAKDGKEYYYYTKGTGNANPNEFFNDFFRRQEELFRQRMDSEEKARMRGSQFKGSDFGQQPGQDFREYKQTWSSTENAQQKKTDQQKWEEEYQKQWDQWQNMQGPGGYSSFRDPLNPNVVAQNMLRMMIVFFGTLILFRLLFGKSKRQEIDPMDEYLYYQLQNDPALSHRLIMNPQAMHPQVNYVKVPYPTGPYDPRYGNPNMPPPSDQVMGHRRPGDERF